MNIEKKQIYSTQKGFKECVREETTQFAPLKSKKYLKTLQRLKQEWQKSLAWDQANRRQKLGLVWRNRKKMSQISNALPFFLLIIL
jgi:hypothetical protein